MIKLYGLIVIGLCGFLLVFFSYKLSNPKGDSFTTNYLMGKELNDKNRKLLQWFLGILGGILIVMPLLIYIFDYSVAIHIFIFNLIFIAIITYLIISIKFHPGKSTVGFIVVIGILLMVTGIFNYKFHQSTSTVAIEVTNVDLIVKTPEAIVIPLKNIKSYKFINELPPIKRKLNGFAAAKHYRGLFLLENDKKAYLYLEEDTQKFLKVESSKGVYYLNGINISNEMLSSKLGLKENEN